MTEVTWDQLSKSPYFDTRFPAEDAGRVGKGVRLLPEKVIYSPFFQKMPLKKRDGGSTNFDDGILFFTCRQPSIKILALFSQLARGRLEDKLPWFSFVEYRDMLVWLDGLGCQYDGDWSRLYDGNYLMVLGGNTNQLAMILSTMLFLQGSYGLLLNLFGKEDYAGLTSEEWENQANMKPIGSAQDMIQNYQFICDRYLLKPPHYLIPSPGTFQLAFRWKNKEVPLSIDFKSYMIVNQQAVHRHLQLYNKVYPKYADDAANSGQSYYECMAFNLQRQWADLAGNIDNYAELQARWGKKEPPPQIDTILGPTLDKDLLEFGTTYALFYPPPSDETFTFMKGFYEAEGNNTLAFPITSFLYIDHFFKSIHVKPNTKNAYDIEYIMKGLRDAQTYPLYIDEANYILSVFYYYIRVMSGRSLGFTQARNFWEWNKDGELVHKRPRPNLDKWPQPWKITEKSDFDHYMEAIAPLPNKRQKAMLEDNEDYKLKCVKADNGYMKWRASVWNNIKALEKYPIGESMKVEIDVEDPEGSKKTEKQTIYNWYPDYGVWDPHDPTDSQWDRVVYFFANFWKSLTGQSMIDWLFALAQKVLDFTIKVLEAAITILDETLKVVGTPLLITLAVVGGAIIVLPQLVGNGSRR